MVLVKKLAAVAAALFLTLGIVASVAAWNTVHAEESGDAVVPFTQFEMANTTKQEQETKQPAAESDGEVALTEEEIPMAEAAVHALETRTEEKGMSSILGFLLVAVAAGTAGGAVALRAKLGGKKRSYVPAEDLTLLKLKK